MILVCNKYIFSDGRNNYPPYDYKYRDKDFNKIQHLKNT